ncbi:hypothetical protein AX15_004705 [Amanita polypyramis BW_CC]|nr:hypothetical protein AX15_004705 [Amanita polypyramis BW_CC]
MHVKSLYPEVPSPPEINVYNALLRRPEQAEWPDYTLQIDAQTGKTRGFRDHIERVQYAAMALGAPPAQGGLGLSSENGDIIGIMSANCMNYVTFVHACLYIATPFALISSHSKPFELKHALMLSKATCLFVDEKFLSTVLPIAQEVGISSSKIFIMTGHGGLGRKSFHQLIHDARARKAEIIDVKPAKKDTLAYLIFSSGTTGLPKAVMITHGNLLFTIFQSTVLAQAVSQVCPPPVVDTPEGIPRALALLPLHHTYGLLVYCVRAFLVPMTLVMMSKWNTELGLSLIPKYHITHLTLIPSVIHQLVHHPKTARTNMSSIISMSCGAAYLPPELGEKMAAFVPDKVKFAEGYGMSETTLSAIIQPLPGMINSTIIQKRGATGILAPGMEARILLEDGATAVTGPGQVGELWLKGPNIAAGYWNNEKATRETFVGGWLRTGDRFWIDEDGHFL